MRSNRKISKPIQYKLPADDDYSKKKWWCFVCRKEWIPWMKSLTQTPCVLFYDRRCYFSLMWYQILLSVSLSWSALCAFVPALSCRFLCASGEKRRIPGRLDSYTITISSKRETQLGKEARERKGSSKRIRTFSRTTKTTHQCVRAQRWWWWYSMKTTKRIQGHTHNQRDRCVKLGICAVTAIACRDIHMRIYFLTRLCGCRFYFFFYSLYGFIPGICEFVSRDQNAEE